VCVLTVYVSLYMLLFEVHLNHICVF